MSKAWDLPQDNQRFWIIYRITMVLRKKKLQRAVISNPLRLPLCWQAWKKGTYHQIYERGGQAYALCFHDKKGWKLQAQINAEFSRLEQMAMQNMSEEDKAMLIQLLSQIYENMAH